LFGAAWTLAYLAIAAREGLAAVTLADCTGDLGVVERREGGHVVHPVAHVLRGMARGHGRPRLETSPVAGLSSVAFQGAAGVELWLANRTPDPITVELDAPALDGGGWLDQDALGARTNLAWLDAASPLPSDRTVMVPPFAIARFVCLGMASGSSG
jgi:hypothetical protein